MSVFTVPATESLPSDLEGETLRYEHLAESLNVLLAETEHAEGRLPMGLNGFGQWCTKGLGGWRPHPSYAHAYHAAHAEEVA